jgi:hypothetical protein
MTREHLGAGWRAALELQLVDLDNESKLDELASLLDLHVVRVRHCIRKLVAARVLRDRGISELADKLLQTHVQAQISGGRKMRR